MRSLKYSINLTLDGCCHHEAVIPDESLHLHSAAIIAEADGLIFGRHIYEMMEQAWRAPCESGVKADWMQDWMMPFAQTIHNVKKYVVSNTLAKVDWNAELIRGDDLEKTVRQLKNQPGKGLYTGGVTLPHTLAELGLIDEYEFIVHPRLVGRGPRLFAGLSKPIDLKLVGQKNLSSGAVAMKYLPVAQR